MKTVIYNYTKSKLTIGMENMAIRAAYILSDSVKSAGNAWQYIFFEEQYKDTKFTQKLQILREAFKAEGYAEWKPVFERSLAVLKVANKVKYKPRNLLLHQNRFNNLINKIYQDWLNSVMSNPEFKSFHELRKLCQDNVFDFYGMSPESAEEENENIIQASKLLLRTLPGFDERSGIFFLPSEFFEDHETEKLTYYSASAAEAADPANAYLEECFMLPAINCITAAELDAVRSQLTSNHPSFIVIMDEWIALCSSSCDVTERLVFFKEKIIPNAAALKKVIEENEILQQCLRLQTHDNTLNILIGEMPVIMLWEFYRNYGVIKDDTWHTLLDEAGNDRYKIRWPVMALKAKYARTADDTENIDAAKALIIPGMKFIPVD